MKQTLTALAVCIAMVANAQNVGIGTPSPNANAKLDITATDKGLLIPRMDSVHRKAIPNTVGLLVYDSTTKSFWVNNGTAWQNMAMAASGWSLTGNGGLDPNINFLGTTDNAPIILKFNNQPAGKIDNGTVSIGADAFSGSSANYNTVPFLTAIGAGALHNNITNPNTAIGGYANTAVGQFSLFANTTGENNAALGTYSLRATTTGKYNTAVGSLAMQYNTTGLNNTSLGYVSLSNNLTGSNNTALGVAALILNEGDENTAVGASAMKGIQHSGSFNTALGAQALSNYYGGSKNTAIGYKADLSNSNAAVTITNATAIGANALVDASNKIRLGDGNVTVVESNGVFNTVSDGRFKYNIKEDVKGIDFIMQLRPVTYQFDAKKQEDFTKGFMSAAQLNSHVIPAAYNENNGIKRTGFIAQEVEAAAQKTGFDFDGVKIPATDKQYYSLSYASFVVPLVKAMQEQQQVIDALKKQNELLQRQNETIIKRLEALEKK